MSRGTNIAIAQILRIHHFISSTSARKHWWFPVCINDSSSPIQQPGRTWRFALIIYLYLRRNSKQIIQTSEAVALVSLMGFFACLHMERWTGSHKNDTGGMEFGTTSGVKMQWNTGPERRIDIDERRLHEVWAGHKVALVVIASYNHYKLFPAGHQ
ncbi:hypothetical protein BDZ91DRAFT_782490 [Kalaharituber pfeilii]|nr:hypothetical protein BDZ91DRAFT_782490 [Kalaharituber pfeilii]